MADLNYNGDEPAWVKQELVEAFFRDKNEVNKSEDQKLRDDINRLQKEREMMAIQLEKTQSLLRL